MSYEEMIAVIEGAKKGKQIECKKKGYNDTWGITASPVFDFFRFDYRIKAEPTVRNMTQRELAKYLATGQGEVKDKYDKIYTDWAYEVGEEDKEVTNYLIRSWDEKEWHKPVVEVKE